MKIISRVSDQNGISLQWYIVEIHHSGWKSLICYSLKTLKCVERDLAHAARHAAASGNIEECCFTQSRQIGSGYSCWYRLGFAVTLPCWHSGKGVYLTHSSPGFDSHWCHESFARSSHTSDLKTGTPVATMPGAWHYRVSAGAGWPFVSLLWLGEIENLICNFCLGVAAHTLVLWADPSLKYTCMLLGR